jgi:hypothetical protein
MWGRNSPAAPLTLAGISDPGQRHMLDSGLYTQSDADRVKTLGFDYYNKKFGLDFPTHGEPYNVGVPGLNALMIKKDGVPYALHFDYKGGSVFDILNVQNNDRPNIQSSKKPWVGMQFGSVVRMLQTGPFTGGSRNGTGHRVNELLSVFFYTNVDVLEDAQSGRLNSTLVGVADAAGTKRVDILVRTHWPISFVYDPLDPQKWTYYANVAEAFDSIASDYEDSAPRKGDFNEIISIVEAEDSESNVRDQQQYRSWINWRTNPRLVKK